MLWAMTTSETPVRGYTPTKDELLKRLRRIEGQVRGIEKMVEDDRYCIDILQQAAAVTAAMDKVALKLLNDHVNHCMAEGAGDAARLKEMTAEMMGAVGRLVR
jgi:CsoR family transcriptional regulator, copper-sensing transcriptional repressor